MIFGFSELFPSEYSMRLSPHCFSVLTKIIKPTNLLRIIFDSICCNPGTFKPLFYIHFLPRICEHAKPDTDIVRDLFVSKQFSRELLQEFFIIVLMLAVQQESISAFPAADAAGFPRKFSHADAYFAQYAIAKLPPELFVGGVEAVHITGHRIQRSILEQMVKPVDIPEEIVSVEQAGQLIALRISNQGAVFSQLDALGNAGFDDLNISMPITPTNWPFQ